MMVGKAIDDVIRTIVGYYGADAQSMQTCEECAELIQAVSKLSRSDTNTKFVERIKNLTEEIADVRIMMSQLMQLYGIPETEIATLVERKLQRQLERIKAESKCEYVV